MSCLRNGSSYAARSQKVIKSAYPSQPEMAQIAINGAEHLYREIRVENELTDGGGWSPLVQGRPRCFVRSRRLFCRERRCQHPGKSSGDDVL